MHVHFRFVVGLERVLPLCKDETIERHSDSGDESTQKPILLLSKDGPPHSVAHRQLWFRSCVIAGDCMLAFAVLARAPERAVWPPSGCSG